MIAIAGSFSNEDVTIILESEREGGLEIMFRLDLKEAKDLVEQLQREISLAPNNPLSRYALNTIDEHY